MSKELAALVQNSLAENDRIRKRQRVAFGFGFLAMLSALYWIGQLAGQAGTDLRAVLVWIVMVVAISYGVLAL
jgi:apolipoprotein N-acyltransferase